MSKQQKRERRKIDRARRASAHAKAVGALAAGAAIAGGTQAYAVPIRFDNPAQGEVGHFDWDDPSAPGLAVYLPASSQPAPTDYYGGQLPGAVREEGGGGFYNVRGYSIRFAIADISGRLLIPVSSGQLIGPTTPVGPFYGYQARLYDLADGHGTLLPEDTPAYIAFRWSQADGTHFGWIGVELNSSTHLADAFAWGYESDPNTPIAAGAPEPGSLALLACGVAGVAIRRRKSA